MSDKTIGEVEIRKIEKILGLQLKEEVSGGYIFQSSRENWIRVSEFLLSPAAVSDALEAANRGAERMAEHEGWLDPARGFAEFEIIQQTIIPLIRRPEEFHFDIHPCLHEHQYEPPTWKEVESDTVSPVARVTSRDGSTCLEISPGTTLCPVPIEANSGRGENRRMTTLKIFLGTSATMQDLTRRARDLANSFLFELSARNRCNYALRPKRSSMAVRRYSGAMNFNVRFPRSSVSNSVSVLFSLPHNYAARGNNTLSYLSYYQILEQYFPAIHKREAVRKIRGIIRSLEFDEGEDSSVLRILHSVERSRGASDGDQLRVLVEECVTEEKITEFFHHDHKGHFGSKGPISGVPPIVMQGKNLPPLHAQVANRVYALRNRIVHAKDDTRFDESQVLLPQSREAMALHSDIDLVRLLATEVICNGR
jgi:hypothetical protein